MKIIYITLENDAQARRIGKMILEARLANCVNFFPIISIYNYKDEIKEEPETVLLVKTSDNKYEKVRDLVLREISYDNFIGQLNVDKINNNFEKWLLEIVK